MSYTWHPTCMSCGGEMAHGLTIYMDVQFSSRGVPVQFVESSKKEREMKERKEGKKREGKPEGRKKRNVEEKKN